MRVSWFALSLLLWAGSGHALTDCASQQVPPGYDCVEWIPPTENVDGTPLTDGAGFRVYYGPASRQYDSMVEVSDWQTTHQLLLLPPGESFIAATAYDVDGNESAYSNEVTRVVQIQYRDPDPPSNFRATLTVSPPTPPAVYSLPPTQFDGTQHVDAGTWSVPGQSLEITAQVVRQIAPHPHARIISKATGGDAQLHDFMLSTYDGGVARFRLKTQGFTTTLVGTTPIPVGVPTEIRATYDGAMMRLYVNGQLDVETPKTGDMDQSTKPVWVGRNPDGFGPWVGEIAVEVR